MSSLQLVIGSKNVSSWSLRPWLLLKQIGLAFEEIVIPLLRPDSRERILAYSPSGRVPVLVMGEVRIWDSLAIAEFLAEHDPGLWPPESRARAMARSISAEMHSGFQSLRTFLPMDFTARFEPPGKLLSRVEADIARITAIWGECRQRFAADGPFLFGSFTIADAMFAPVCSRFATYAIPLDPVCAAYVAHMMGLPAMREWGRAAAAEVAGEAPAPLAASPAREPSLREPPVRDAAEERLPRLPPHFGREIDNRPPLPARGAAPPDDPFLPQEFAAPRVPQPRPAPLAVVEPLQPTAPPAPARAAMPRDEAAMPLAPEPAEEDRYRQPRPIPSTIMIKPIGDGTRRRR
jgi:glutathione S-transferase